MPAAAAAARDGALVEAAVMVVPRQGGQAIVAAAPGRSTRTLARGSDLVPSPDGTRMLVLRRGVWYTMHANGTHARRLPGAGDQRASWSPNSRLIALYGEERATLDVIGRDASTAVAVARHVSAVSWSSDSRELVYAFDPQTAGVYTMPRAGGAPAATVLKEGQWASQPDWSPDGRRIAYLVGRAETRDVYVANADGSAPVRLTTTEADESEPAWSPDGRQIAFASARDGNWEIYVMNTDGTEQRRVTSHASRDRAPTWSPDARRLAFHTSRFGNAEILAIDPDGSNTVRVTSDNAANRDPDWAPDGSSLVYSASGNLSVVGADGTAVERLTERELDEKPQWSPDGSRIVFERRGEIMTIDPVGGEPSVVYGGGVPAVDPAWSSGGDISFWIAHSSDLARLSVGTRTEQRLTQTARDERAPQWAPRRQAIAFLGSEGIAVRDLRLGTETTIAPDAASFGWSPSGRFIAYADLDGRLFRVRADGSQRRGIVATRFRAVYWAWAPRDDRLAYAVTDDGWGVELAIVSAGGAKQPVRPADLDALSPPVWSPSGEKLAYSGAVRPGIGVYVYARGARSATRVRHTRSWATVRGFVRVRM